MAINQFKQIGRKKTCDKLMNDSPTGVHTLYKKLNELIGSTNISPQLNFTNTQSSTRTIILQTK